VQTPSGFYKPIRFPDEVEYRNTPGNGRSLPVRAFDSAFKQSGSRMCHPVGSCDAARSMNVTGNVISTHVDSLDTGLHILGSKTPLLIRLFNHLDKRLSLPAPLQIHTPEYSRMTSISSINIDRAGTLPYFDQNRASGLGVSHRGGLIPAINLSATVTEPVAPFLEDKLVVKTHSFSLSLPPPSPQSQPLQKRNGYRLPQRPRKYRLPQRPSVPPTLEKIRKMLVQDPTGHAACTAITTGLDLREAVENGGLEQQAAVEGLTEILEIVIGLDAAVKTVERYMRGLLAEIRGEALSSPSHSDGNLEHVPGVASHMAVRSEVGDFLKLKFAGDF
jgi:hypothetical protein